MRSFSTAFVIGTSLGFLLGTLLASSPAHAWGRRGHSIVCEVAASLLDKDVLKQHSFDLGYYCNVPDLVWKKPATYAVEAPQHFMDMEIFERTFAAAPTPGTDPFALSRKDFEAKYPSIPVSAGRSFWRIREVNDLLTETSNALKTADASVQFKLQEEWLVRAGAIGHYVGDLSQPLHVTEDFDGQKENQRGIHAFFEDVAVDELFNEKPSKLEADVATTAFKKWKTSSLKSAPLLQVLETLAKETDTKRGELLKLDKKIGRKDLKMAAHAFEPLIKDRLVAGAVALAAIWSHQLEWAYKGEKFYNFTGMPDYIYPLGSSATAEGANLPGVSATSSAPKTAVSPPSGAPAGPTPKP